MARSVGAYEAKTHLSRLLDEVARGETITITKHGVPVARLVPPEYAPQRTVAETIEALREFRKGKTLGGITIRELIEEGRRF
jgi:prevent-host-death family protein